MSIKQKLEWGIFPIASRRHQPRDNSGTFHEFPHDWTPEESKFVVILWLLTPIMALLGPALSSKQFDYGETLFLFILLDLWVTWEIKHS